MFGFSLDFIYQWMFLLPKKKVSSILHSFSATFWQIKHNFITWKQTYSFFEFRYLKICHTYLIEPFFSNYICFFLKEKKNYALPELEVSRLSAIVKILKDTSHYHSTKFADADVVLLLNLLRSWPRESLFPGNCNFFPFLCLLP